MQKYSVSGEPRRFESSSILCKVKSHHHSTINLISYKSIHLFQKTKLKKKKQKKKCGIWQNPTLFHDKNTQQTTAKRELPQTKNGNPGKTHS